MIPFPSQLTGAAFLASRDRALLADEPRVGKTGALIMAVDYNLEVRILIVTTASGRPVWRKAISDWSAFPRKVQVIAKDSDHIRPDTTVVIVGWGAMTNAKIRAMLIGRKWDRLILDEEHYAKSFEAKRTQAVYGELEHGGAVLSTATALIHAANGKVWAATGTPQPNSPADWYPRLRALKPECLRGSDSMPDVTKYEHFLHRYCVVKRKKISNFRSIPVVIGGRNLEELRARIGDFMLRRTQQDVGIRKPIYETLPLAVSDRVRREIEQNVDATVVLAAADGGNTRELDMHLGPVRRLTGEIKAKAVVTAVEEEFECGLDKIVLAYWHKDVGHILKDGLSSYGVVGVDGSTSANKREENVRSFQTDPNTRVFLAQIEAAGEAIDLSRAAMLWFVETVFSPRAMKQMSLRITNHTQTRQAFVRVCVLEGSIDESVETVLLRKWAAIREVIA